MLENFKTKGKGILDQVKGFWNKLGAKTKKLILGTGLLTAGVLLVFVFMMNHKNYTVLYPSVSAEEAGEIAGKLSEAGIDYQYKPNGDILVPAKQVDQVRADLAVEGYPKSGFAYDIFIDNAGGMTTDSDKQTYKLYELQNRIGATICLFDGVKDAKVTIALGEQQKYVLEETDTKKVASASVVVKMKDGGSPSREQAAAFQRLVAKSVANMSLENVAVFDGNGIEVTALSDLGSESSADMSEITNLIEGQISGKIMNVLTAIYGPDNVRVSVKGTVNMEKLIRESITYLTPDKIDENDKQGIVSKESLANEAGSGGMNEGGLTGTETNSDVTEYNTITSDSGGSNYNSSTVDREFLVNQIKEQGQVDPGVLEDLTVAVAINGEDFGSLNMNQLKSLVGNAAGIPAEDQATKITVVNAPFYKEAGGVLDTEESLQDILKHFFNSIYFLIAIGVLILLLLLFILLKRAARKRRRRKAERVQPEAPAVVPVAAAAPVQPNMEIINMQNERARSLRENVREFTEQNPEISAQLIKTWLNGGEKE